MSVLGVSTFWMRKMSSVPWVKNGTWTALGLFRFKSTEGLNLSEFLGALPVMRLYRVGILKKMDSYFAKMITGRGMERPVNNVAKLLLDQLWLLGNINFIRSASIVAHVGLLLEMAIRML